ncbi:MAG: hypothetical protein CMJ84_14965 [Planctomycetes bacterium]|nr:hypothetical protein [Planctomycetota bacterium]
MRALFAIPVLLLIVLLAAAISPAADSCICSSAAKWRLVGGWFLSCPLGDACDAAEGTCSEVQIGASTVCRCTTSSAVNKDDECSCSVVLSGEPPNHGPSCENLGSCSSPRVCKSRAAATTFTCSCGDPGP